MKILTTSHMFLIMCRCLCLDRWTWLYWYGVWIHQHVTCLLKSHKSTFSVTGGNVETISRSSIPTYCRVYILLWPNLVLYRCYVASHQRYSSKILICRLLVSWMWIQSYYSVSWNSRQTSTSWISCTLCTGSLWQHILISRRPTCTACYLTYYAVCDCMTMVSKK